MSKLFRELSNGDLLYYSNRDAPEDKVGYTRDKSNKYKLIMNKCKFLIEVRDPNGCQTCGSIPMMLACSLGVKQCRHCKEKQWEE